jgi:DNA-binding transcriptional MerR regulator
MVDPEITQDNMLYSIQEVSKRSGLSVPTLRYYEEVGLIPVVARDKSSGHRRYDAETLHHIESLSNLRTVGMSIEEMRSYLLLRDTGDETAIAKRDLFKRHASGIEKEINKLQTRLRYLALKVAYWDARAAGDIDKAEPIGKDYEAIVRELQ